VPHLRRPVAGDLLLPDAIDAFRGHSTSFRLEATFWTILEEIAATENLSLPKFLTTLHDEVLEFGGEAGNFTLLLRCDCLTYVGQVRSKRNDDHPRQADGQFGSANSSHLGALEHAV
jgi:predicted DNA-binding ribbon-helix-helix protein